MRSGGRCTGNSGNVGRTNLTNPAQNGGHNRNDGGGQAAFSGYCPERTGTTTGACGGCVDEYLTKWGNTQAAGAD